VSISATNFNLPSIRELIEQVISKSKSEYVGEESLLGFWKTTEVVFEFEFSPRLSFTGILDSYGSQWEVTKSSIRGNWCPTNHSITALRVSLFQGLARGYVVALFLTEAMRVPMGSGNVAGAICIGILCTNRVATGIWIWFAQREAVEAYWRWVRHELWLRYLC
jgi:hypothetical protein